MRIQKKQSLNVPANCEKKNERLSIALHDLKNILSAIQCLAEMIKNDEMPKENVINLAVRILTASKFLFELITNLLEVNTIESGKMSLSQDLISTKS